MTIVRYSQLNIKTKMFTSKKTPFRKIKGFVIFTNKTFYRGGGEGSILKNHTLQDILNYEQEELGNDLIVMLDINPEKISSNNLCWVCERKEDAEEYGEARPVFISKGRIVAKDSFGGVIVEKLPSSYAATSFTKKITSETLLYHGRHGEDEYSGSGIYVTPDKEYAKRYAGSEELFVYTLNIPESKIFSFNRPQDFDKIKPYYPPSHWNGLLGNLNNGEMDWAGIGDLANPLFEETEDFLSHLGYCGLYVTERTDVFSVYLFNPNNLTLVRRENVSTY